MNEEQKEHERKRIEYLAALRESAIIERDTRENVEFLKERYPEDIHDILDAQNALEEWIKTTDFHARRLYQHLTEHAPGNGYMGDDDDADD